MSVAQTVRDSFPQFTKRFEGRIHWLYEDRLGLMTTGLGNLLDTQPPSPEPTALALSLPWLRPDKTRASRSEIAEAWRAVRAHPELRALDGRAYEPITTLRISDDTIDHMVTRKLDEHDAILSERFPEYPGWPATAQLALHSMAWALGARFRFPKFEQAARQDPPDFEAMAAFSKIQGGLPLRNSVNHTLFQAAGAAQKDLPPERWAELTVDPSVVFGADPVAITVPGYVAPRPNWTHVGIALGMTALAAYGARTAYTRYRPRIVLAPAPKALAQRSHR